MLCPHWTVSLPLLLPMLRFFQPLMQTVQLEMVGAWAQMPFPLLSLPPIPLLLVALFLPPYLP